MKRDEGEVVLVVDDDLFSRRLIAENLKRLGYGVREAHNAHDAMQCLTEEDIVLCVVDYHLPGGTCAEVVGYARTELEVPSIIVTGDVSLETERSARALSPVFFFVKPIEPRDFRSVVKTALRKDRRHDRLHYR